GGQFNAFTSKEYTCYYAKVLDEHFPMALHLLSEMFFHSLLDEQELAKEKQVILEEIRMYEDTPDELVHELLAKAAFGAHPLGASVSGTKEALAAMQRDDLLEFMRQAYTPENTVIAIAGRIPPDVLQLVEEAFSQFSTSHEPFSTQRAPFCRQTILQPKETEQIHLCLGYPGLAIHDERIHTVSILNNIIGGSMSSRLFQRIREDHGLAYSIFSYHTAHLQEGLFAVYTGTSPEHGELVMAMIREIVEEICDEGITEEELKIAREQIKGNLVLSLESTNSRMSRLGRNELLLRRHWTVDEVLEKLNRITREDVLAVARDIFQDPPALAAVGGEASLAKLQHSFSRTMSDGGKRF
ncbi:MAG: zinc protease, partial [Bacillaceae bacterium G1]